MEIIFTKSFIRKIQFSSVAQSCLTLRPHGPQHARHSCPSPTPGVYPNSCLLSWWCHPTIWSFVVPFSSHLQSFPESGFFKGVSSSYQVAKVLEFQLQHQPFQWTLRTDLLYDGLVGCPCSPRDSQESSPTPQFKSNNSLALNFLYSPILTSIHDLWFLCLFCSDFGAPQNKVCHCFHCFPISLPCSDRAGCYNLSFLNVES